jgi:hypothetical protein
VSGELKRRAWRLLDCGPISADSDLDLLRRVHRQADSYAFEVLLARCVVTVATAFQFEPEEFRSRLAHRVHCWLGGLIAAPPSLRPETPVYSERGSLLPGLWQYLRAFEPLELEHLARLVLAYATCTRAWVRPSQPRDPRNASEPNSVVEYWGAIQWSNKNSAHSVESHLTDFITQFGQRPQAKSDATYLLGLTGGWRWRKPSLVVWRAPAGWVDLLQDADEAADAIQADHDNALVKAIGNAARLAAATGIGVFRNEFDATAGQLVWLLNRYADTHAIGDAQMARWTYLAHVYRGFLRQASELAPRFGLWVQWDQVEFELAGLIATEEETGPELGDAPAQFGGGPIDESSLARYFAELREADRYRAELVRAAVACGFTGPRPDTDPHPPEEDLAYLRTVAHEGSRLYGLALASPPHALERTADFAARRADAAQRHELLMDELEQAGLDQYREFDRTQFDPQMTEARRMADARAATTGRPMFTEARLRVAI